MEKSLANTVIRENSHEYLIEVTLRDDSKREELSFEEQ